MERKEVGMKLLVLILNKVEVLEELLAQLANAHIVGATILNSTGMVHTLSSYDEEISFMGSLRAILNPDREESKTIMAVLRDEQIPKAIQVIESVVGDLSKEDTGVVFTVPVDFQKGMHIEGNC